MIKPQSQTDSCPAWHIMESCQRLQALVPDRAIGTQWFWKAFSDDLNFLTSKPKAGLGAPSIQTVKAGKCSSFWLLPLRPPVATSFWANSNAEGSAAGRVPLNKAFYAGTVNLPKQIFSKMCSFSCNIARPGIASLAQISNVVRLAGPEFRSGSSECQAALHAGCQLFCSASSALLSNKNKRESLNISLPEFHSDCVQRTRGKHSVEKSKKLAQGSQNPQNGDWTSVVSSPMSHKEQVCHLH